MTQITRRGVLGRLLLGAGAAVGIGAGGVAAARAREEATPPVTTTSPRPQAMTLHARSLRTPPAHRDPRAGLARDDAPFGDLLDERLQPIGDFRSVALATGGSFHTFTLPTGQLFGLGAGGLEGTAHAIVGGTGRYAGASGSYAIEPAASLPGRSLTFSVTLTALEA